MKVRKLFLLPIAIICIFSLSFCLVFRCQNEKVEQLEADLSLLKEEFVPLAFQIKERPEGRIVLKVKLLDSEDNLINTANFDLIGDELMIDILVFQQPGQPVLAFPYKIFTDKTAPVDGADLTQYYLSPEGFPLIYNQEGLQEAEIVKLTELFQNLYQEENQNISGSLVHDIKEITQFSTGIVYSVVCHTRGGIEIVED